MNIKDESKALIYISGLICLAFAALAMVMFDDSATYAENYDFLMLVGKKSEIISGILAGFVFNAAKITMTGSNAYSYESTPAHKISDASQYLVWFVLAVILLSASLILPISFLGTFFGICSLKLAENFMPRLKKV